jgi:hypothetical protein
VIQRRVVELVLGKSLFSFAISIGIMSILEFNSKLFEVNVLTTSHYLEI